MPTNDSCSPRFSEHDGEERMDLSSSVLELYFREGGHVLAKIATQGFKMSLLVVEQSIPMGDYQNDRYEPK